MQYNVVYCKPMMGSAVQLLVPLYSAVCNVGVLMGFMADGWECCPGVYANKVHFSVLLLCYQSSGSLRSLAWFFWL